MLTTRLPGVATTSANRDSRWTRRRSEAPRPSDRSPRGEKRQRDAGRPEGRPDDGRGTFDANPQVGSVWSTTPRHPSMPPSTNLVLPPDPRPEAASCDRSAASVATDNEGRPREPTVGAVPPVASSPGPRSWGVRGARHDVAPREQPPSKAPQQGPKEVAPTARCRAIVPTLPPTRSPTMQHRGLANRPARSSRRRRSTQAPTIDATA